jgi:flagellar protein FliS
MNPYQTCATEGASGVELTIALYDGIIRFMFRAIEAVDNGDVRQRRLAVKRALDITIHLQATLRMDVGGKPAQALAEFYAVIFALMLQGSQANCKDKFLRVITLVKNVRDAWRQVARDPEAMAMSRTQAPVPMAVTASAARLETTQSGNANSSWTA